MKITRASAAVFETDEDLIRVDRSLVELLRNEAPSTLRKRVRFNAHGGPGEVVQEMIIALALDSYIPPHKHLGKSESFHLIEGELDIVIFDAEGRIRDLVRMGDYASGGVFYYRNDRPVFHSVVPRSGTVIFHETTRGPFVPDETVHANWAPVAEGPEALRYLAELRDAISQFPASDQR